MGEHIKKASYNSTCTKGDDTGCRSGWKCTSNNVCTSLWYNVTGKEPLRDTGLNYVKAVARGDFDIGAGDNFVTESRAKNNTTVRPIHDDRCNSSQAT